MTVRPPGARAPRASKRRRDPCARARHDQRAEPNAVSVYYHEFESKTSSPSSSIWAGQLAMECADYSSKKNRSKKKCPKQDSNLQPPDP